MDSTRKDTYYMELALAQAHKAYHAQEVPIGAVLVSNHHIIAQGYNQVQQQADATAHAELEVLRVGCQQMRSKYLINCTLYTTLEPCPMCAAACYWTQLHRLVFAARDVKRGYRCVSSSLIHPKTHVVTGLLEEQSRHLLQGFFQHLREHHRQAQFA